jgi:transposase
MPKESTAPVQFCRFDAGRTPRVFHSANSYPVHPGPASALAGAVGASSSPIDALGGALQDRELEFVPSPPARPRIARHPAELQSDPFPYPPRPPGELFGERRCVCSVAHSDERGTLPSRACHSAPYPLPSASPASFARSHARKVTNPATTIAAQLGIHEDVVRRVLGLLKPRPGAGRAERPSLLVVPYMDFINETLQRYPRLRSTRFLDMLKERGFRGSARTLRRFVMSVRPAPKREAFLRLDPLIGEQAQIDWAHVGQLPVPGGGGRSLWLFVMVLAWSRASWGEFVFDTTVHSLLRSLVRASLYFGGLARQWLFDNPKIVVLERHGDAARFHLLLLDLGSALHVQLRLCGPYRGNEKGRVERKIRFFRDRFLAGREIYDIEQGNRELLAFLDTIAHQQRHPNFPQRTVADCLAEERQRLLPLPDPMPATDLVDAVLIDKTAFARFDTNLYSVPPDYVERTLTIVADDRSVRVLDGASVVAHHSRSWGHRQKIEHADYRAEILRRKQGAAPSAGRDRLRVAAPAIDVLIERWVEAGRNIGSMVAQTSRLLDLYGPDVFGKAVAETVERGTHDPGEVGVLCEKHRRAGEQPVPIDIPLSDGVPDRDVIPHDLGGYDAKR